MTKILVTGAFGLLGSSLTPYLSACGHEVIRHARCELGDFNADLTDLHATNVLLNEVFPDVIVNLVALTNVDECEKNPQKAYLYNVRTLENLVQWIKNRKPDCHLVQISTDQIYDGVGPHQEGNIVLRNYYGFSKYAAELVASSVFSTILRTNFFGPSQCKHRESLSDWLIRSLKKGDAIKVFDDIYFSPLSLQNLVKFIELVIVKRKEGLYNLGSKQGMSKADFAYRLAEALNLPVQMMQRDSSKSIDLKADRPKKMHMDSSKFERTFGIELPSLLTEIESLKTGVV